MTRDKEKQAKAAKPGIEGADRTALVDLMFQRAGEKMKAALAEKDDTRIVHLAMDACHEARFALEEMHQQHVDPATVVDAAEAFDFALVDVLARVHRLDQQRHARDAGIHHASELCGKLDLTMRTTFEPHGMRAFFRDASTAKPQGERRAQDAAEQHGLDALTAGEKAKLGRLHIKAAEQNVLDGWSRIVEGNGDSALGAADLDLRQATVLLGDPAVLGELGSLGGELATLEAVMDRIVVQVQYGKQPRYTRNVTSMAAQVDHLLAIAGGAPRWTEQMKGATSWTA